MGKRDTKGLILDTSLALFNESGVPNVSTNEIALEADISPGNLYYHYNHKHDIVEALLKRFEQAIAPLLDVEDGPDDLEDFWFYLHVLFERIAEYRFLFRNLPDLYDRTPELTVHLDHLLERIGNTISARLDTLEASGVLQASDAERTALAETIRMTLIFWIPYQSRFLETSTDTDPAALAVNQILLQVAPFLETNARRVLLEVASQYTP